MINLLGHSQGLVEAGQKYRGMIHAVTVVVAVGYLVLVAAAAGWWVWAGARKSQVVGERDTLVRQMGQLAAAEAVVRQVASRADMVEAALAEAKQGPTLAGVLEGARKQGLEVISWQEGVVRVGGTDPQTLESFANGLEVKSVTRGADGKWEEEVVWK